MGEFFKFDRSESLQGNGNATFFLNISLKKKGYCVTSSTFPKPSESGSFPSAAETTVVKASKNKHTFFSRDISYQPAAACPFLINTVILGSSGSIKPFQQTKIEEEVKRQKVQVILERQRNNTQN